MKNQHYFVTLKLTLGEFEKYTTSIVTAENEEEAKRVALEGECHDRPFIFNEDPDVCDDGATGMIYEVCECRLIPQEDLAVLRKYI